MVANGTNFAVVDSYISDIHQSTWDSQAILAYWTPGPIKIVDNFLSASTEDVMFGGVMSPNLPYIPSDIEIRDNHFFKPMSWRAVGITLPPNKKWCVKNNLEFKDAQRVIVTGNTMENNWASCQVGLSVLFTPRASGAGSIALVDDITVDNNTLINVDGGFSSLNMDYNCAKEPGCTFPGEAKRIKLSNNRVLLSSEHNNSKHVGLMLVADLSDWVFQHNTVLMMDGSTCWASLYFQGRKGEKWPPPKSLTRNIWVLDNVLCRQPTGDWGGQGISGLTGYMGDPAPLDPRFFNNTMYVPAEDKPQTFPPHNKVTTQKLSLRP